VCLKKSILITYPDTDIIKEAVELAKSADYEVTKIITQKFLLKSKYGLSQGKAETLKSLLMEYDAELIIFDEKIKSTQIYNLTKITGVEVIDREKLILEIFAKRALTTEAKLQVKLAELIYEMPRAKEKVRMAKIGEQPGFFGLGKYDVDIYYDMIKTRIVNVKKRLQEVIKRRELYRFRRNKLNIPLISFAGYTGAGKTSLFNILTGEKKDTSRGFFTTLTTTTRSIELSGFRVLITDTVGFISRLPTYMIEAFKSTLEELNFADLILLILDASQSLQDLKRKYQSCINVMLELGISPDKVMIVLNKLDLTKIEEIKENIKEIGIIHEKSIITSAKTGFGIENLRLKIDTIISEYVESEVFFEKDQVITLIKNLDWFKKNAQVNLVKKYNGGIIAKIKGQSWIIDRFNTLKHKIVIQG